MSSKKLSKSYAGKRSLMIINLVETPQGYSVIQGTQLLNKSAPVVNQILNTNIPNSLSSATVPANSTTSVAANTPIIKEVNKSVIKQKNLLFLKSPVDFQRAQKEQDIKKSINQTPREAKQYAQWLDIHKINSIQQKQLKVWFMQDNPKIQCLQNIDIKSQPFMKTVAKYKQHRNLIIKVFYQEYWPDGKFFAASKIRKYISDDAYWLMRIHIFLTNWGIINKNHINIQNQTFNAFQVINVSKRPRQILKHKFRPNNEGSNKMIEEQKQSESSDQKKKQYQNIASSNQLFPSLQEQTSALLSELTQKIRPYCDFCGIKCSIVWFHHCRAIQAKEIATIMKNVNSKNPPLSEKQYEINLCTNCYCNGSFPLLLTHYDFKKVTVNDQLEPNRKKRKQKKNKRKHKKIAQKNRERQLNMEQEDQGEAREEKDDYNQKNDEQIERQSEQIQNNKNKAQELLNKPEEAEQAKNNLKNGDYQQNNHQAINHEVQQKINTQPNQAITSQEIITDLLNNPLKKHQWKPEETLLLLQLVGQYGQNWEKIHLEINNKKYCSDCSVEDLISHFVFISRSNQLPMALNQEYELEQFITSNLGVIYKTNFLNKVVEKNYKKLQKMSKRNLSQDNQNSQKEYINKWKSQLNSLVALTIKKIENRSQLLQKMQEKAKNISIETEKLLKEI